MDLFNKRLINEYIEKNIHIVREKELFHTEIIERIINFIKQDADRTKEKPIQTLFLQRVFEEILGYPSQLSGEKKYNLLIEPTTDFDSSEPDGALGFFDSDLKRFKAVLELKPSNIDLDKKQTNRKDNKSPVEQAFGYSYKFDSCKWVIVSNFKEIRLYNIERGINFYQKFNILDLHDENEFRKFYFIFNKDNLLSLAEESLIEKLAKETNLKEENITKEFYSKYKETRNRLYKQLSDDNPQIDKIIILEKTQKIIDRVIFISFCEDLGLLPYNILRNILKIADYSYDLSEHKLWNQLKGLFDSINIGNPNKNINKFNGGLFTNDKFLSDLNIKDEVLIELLKISDYDFESELNVNILGHIFEQSISDIEEMKANINKEETVKKEGKRKKEGIYYTPEYITKYIVEQAVGGWLQDRKEELGFNKLPELSEENYRSLKIAKGKVKANVKTEAHIKFWERYRDILQNIKVLDLACGSGAFLIQAFDYLYKEGQLVNDELAKLKKGQRQIFDLDKHILTNNIYGVDLNEESVEITKLSLWLKTANKNKELTSLDENIKCGNSLIDDPIIAENKAFNWNKEFKEILSDGGFNVIISNPPYISSIQLTKQFEKNIKNYWKNKFNTATGTYDIYILFFEQSIKLLNNKGILSYITPNKYLSAPYGEGLRKYIKNSCSLIEIFDLSKIKIFDDPSVYPIITVLKKEPLQKYYFKTKEILNITNQNIKESKLSSDILFALPNYMYSLALSKHSEIIIKIIKDSKTLSELSSISATSTAAESDEFSKYIFENPLEGMKLVNTGTIDKYISLWGYREMLNKGKKYLKPKLDVKSLKISSHRSNIYNSQKIIFSKISKKIEAFLDSKGEYASINTNCVFNPINCISLEFLLGIINSKLMNFFYNECFNALRMSGGYMQFQAPQIKILPIKTKNGDIIEEIRLLVIEIINKFDKKYQILQNCIDIIRNEFKLLETTEKLEKLFYLNWTELVKELEKHNENLSINRKEDFRDWYLQKQKILMDLKIEIDELDGKLNQNVFKLYDLTDSEISIIENLY